VALYLFDEKGQFLDAEIDAFGGANETTAASRKIYQKAPGTRAALSSAVEGVRVRWWGSGMSMSWRAALGPSVYWIGVGRAAVGRPCSPAVGVARCAAGRPGAVEAGKSPAALGHEYADTWKADRGSPMDQS
jgi:hypothetical protein